MLIHSPAVPAAYLKEGRVVLELKEPPAIIDKTDSNIQYPFPYFVTSRSYSYFNS